MTDIGIPVPFDPTNITPPGAPPIPEFFQAGDSVWVPAQVLHVNMDGTMCVLVPRDDGDGEITEQKVDRIPAFSVVPRIEE